MSGKNKLFLITAVLFLCTGGICANTEVSLPPMKHPPVIDGKIEEYEWLGAAEFAGWQMLFSGILEPRSGYSFIGYDDKNFYFALKCKLAPDGKVLANGKTNGKKVLKDDRFEVVVLPPGKRPFGPKHEGCFQFIVNDLGNTYTRHYNPGYGLAARGWDINMKFKSSRRNGFWELETAVPLAEFGCDKMIFSKWCFILARRWNYPVKLTCMTDSENFINGDQMAILNPKKNCPAIQVRSIDGLLKGTPDIKINIYNPENGEKNVVLTEINVKADGKNALNEKRETELDPGQDKNISVKGHFKPGKINSYSIRVTEKESGRILHSRSFNFEAMPEHKRDMPEEFLTFRASFDDSLSAQKAAGNPEPLKVTGKPEFSSGYKGKALLVNPGTSILYSSKKNLQTPFCVIFNVKFPGFSSAPKARNFLWYTLSKKDGYCGIQELRQGKIIGWFQYFPEIKSATIIKRHKLQSGNWHNMALNVGKTGTAELYIDGTIVAKKELGRGIKSSELANFCIGNPRGNQAFLIDHLEIYSKALSPDEIKKLAMGDNSADGKIYWFPSINSLVLEGVLSEKKLEGSSLSLKISDMSEKIIAERKIPGSAFRKLKNGLTGLRCIIKIPELKEGNYSTWIEKNCDSGKKGGATLKRTFSVKHYEWLGNKLGKSDMIIPPFTALEVKDGKVKCILRSYSPGPLGLWKQVKTLGKNILAAPIQIKAESNGKTISFSPEEKLNFVEKKPATVITRGKEKSKTLDIEAECKYEYDGFMMVDLKIKPGAQHEKIDRLRLEIPVKKEFARFFHACGEHLRANPAGYIPKGEGVVWKSTSIPQPNIEDNFIAYIWVGDEERGICWAADWDKDWIHDKNKKRAAVELEREKDGVVKILVNLINGPVELQRERNIQFALQASPVKPRPENWQMEAFNFGEPGNPYYRIMTTVSGGVGTYGPASKYPANCDFTVINKLAETKKTGNIDREFVEKWIKRLENLPYPVNPKFKTRKNYVPSHIKGGFKHAKELHDLGKGKLVFYSCACYPSDLLPESKVYGDEWQFMNRMHQVASFRDYAVWYANRMMEEGMDAIYVDNSFPEAKYSWPCNDAYINEKGEIIPNVGLITRMRPLIKRLAVMMYEKGREPFVYVHNTNSNTIPMLAFAQATIGWENKYGSNSYQERFTPDYIHAVNRGSQTGVIPTVTGGNIVKKDSPEDIALTRSGFALILPHQLFFTYRVNNEIGKKAAKIIQGFLQRGKYEEYPYWKNSDIVNTSGKDTEKILVTFYKSGNSLLFIIGNNGKKTDVRIKVDTSKLGLGKIENAVNRENNKQVDFNDESISLEIPGQDFRLIGIQCAPDKLR